MRAGEYEESYGSADSILNMITGIDISAQFTFGEKKNRFFIRPEAGILLNNGIGKGYRFVYEDYPIGLKNDSDCSISVTTIELPLLLGMETDFRNWSIDYYLGPYLSIPITGSLETASGTSQLNFSSPVFGGTAGMTGNLNVGPGAFTVDVRYLFDLGSTRMDISDSDNSTLIYARRNIILSAGYKLIF